MKRYFIDLSITQKLTADIVALIYEYVYHVGYGLPGKVRYIFYDQQGFEQVKEALRPHIPFEETTENIF